MNRAQIVEAILIERGRQVAEEGYDAAHDERHWGGELERAVAAFALDAASYAELGPDHRGNMRALARIVYPWGEKYRPKSRRDCLIKAGALVVAALERLAIEEGDGTHEAEDSAANAEALRAGGGRRSITDGTPLCRFGR